eukprot:458878-Amphidinium_carterae.1
MEPVAATAEAGPGVALDTIQWHDMTLQRIFTDGSTVQGMLAEGDNGLTDAIFPDGTVLHTEQTWIKPSAAPAPATPVAECAPPVDSDLAGSDSAPTSDLAGSSGAGGESGPATPMTTSTMAHTIIDTAMAGMGLQASPSRLRG